MQSSHDTSKRLIDNTIDFVSVHVTYIGLCCYARLDGNVTLSNGMFSIATRIFRASAWHRGARV